MSLWLLSRTLKIIIIMCGFCKTVPSDSLNQCFVCSFLWQPIGFVHLWMMGLSPNPFSRLLLAGIILSLIHTIHMWAAPGWAAAPAPSSTQRSPHGPRSHATPASPPTPRWTAPNPKTTSSSPSSPASALSGQSTLWDLFTPSWYVELGPFDTEKTHRLL